MSIQIHVDPAQLDACASHIESLVDIYEKEYRALFTGIAQLQDSWKGKDNQAFVTQIQGFEKDFIAMRDIMREYAMFLRKASSAYRDVQTQRMLQARKLVN